MNVLEVGGGETPRYRPNLDYRALATVDIVHDITIIPWPVASGSIDFVYTSHCLEHVSPDQVIYVLTEIWRILHVQGKIEIHVPDIERLCKRHDWQLAVYRIFGGKTLAYGLHKSGFWKVGLEDLMQKLGWSNVNVMRAHYPRSVCYPTPELVCKAQKIMLRHSGLLFR